MLKKIYLIILLILLVIAAGIVYFYLKNYKVPEKLTAYLPRATGFYAEFNLKDKNLTDFKANNLRGQARFEGLITKTKFFGELSNYLLQETEQVAVLKFKEKDNWPVVWLVKSPNVKRLSALLPADYYSSILNNQTLAISKDRQSLKLLKEVSPLTEHTKEQREILEKFSDNNFINIYLSSEYLEYLSSQPDPIYVLVLNNLKLDLNKPAFLGLKAANNYLVYDFQSKSSQENSQSSLDDEIKNILSNFTNENLFLTFLVPGLNDILMDWDKEIISAEKKQEWSKKYEFQWDEVEELLNIPTIIFVQSKTPKIEKEEILTLDSYNYGLVLKTNWPAAEMLKKIELIKKVVKNILAFKYPSEKIKRLPDGTKSTELVAEPKQFKFTKENNLDFIQVDNFHFALGYQNNYLIMGNNKELLKNVLENLSQAANGNNIPCPNEILSTGQELALINGRQLVEGLLSYVDETIIKIKQDGQDINLNGCLAW